MGAPLNQYVANAGNYEIRPNVAAIRQRAKATAERLLMAAWDEDKFPVDPFEIATSLDLQVYTADLPEDVSGLSKKATGEIYVKTSDHERRQRFTAAHELGHLSDAEDQRDINIDRPRDALAEQGTSPYEIFANEFAANLLMPEAQVKTLRKLGMGASSMARFFDVSVLAMSHRLDNLGIA